MLKLSFCSNRSLAIGWSLLIFIVLCMPARDMNVEILPFPHADKLVHFFLFSV